MGRQGAEPVDVRRLLSPWWVPYRHGLDAITDLATAAVNEGEDAAERRRAARIDAHGPGRTARPPTRTEELAADTGLAGPARDQPDAR